ncbi:MAG: hypothetical protein HZC36_07010 [Armatimonadetes bacterium]|nr:hypothetical protein [Armatimonadota bacterium]
MFTCHLTKLEAAVEQVRKTYPKMRPTDVALLASALVLTGRHAVALYDGNQYRWPEDYDKLTKALVTEIDQIQESAEPVKKTKTSPEEEPVQLNVGLSPNYSAGEARLKERKDLQATLSELLQGGVEFVYSPTDIGWQWALERANWNTISGGELARRIKVKANFSDGAVGVEMGSTTKKRAASRAKAKVEEEPVAVAEPEVEVEFPVEVAAVAEFEAPIEVESDASAVVEAEVEAPVAEKPKKAAKGKAAK